MNANVSPRSGSYSTFILYRLVIISVFSAARVTVAHTVRHSRCVLRKRGWLGSWAWEGLELKKTMVAHRPQQAKCQ